MATKKTVLVTGCSAGGIGYALAEEFQKQGLTVFATARSVSKMAGLEGLAGVTLLPLDVTSAASVEAAVADVAKRTGGALDYLVNNAGQSGYMPALDQDIDAAKRLFEVNFWSVLRTIQAFAPLLIAAKGTIVNVGSINAIVHPPFCAVYNASKASIHSLDETLRMELKPLDVKVLTVVTGTIRTNIQSNVPKVALPAGSLYHPAQAYLDKMYEGTAHPNKMEPSVYAQQVVGDVLGGVTGKTWRGANASTARYATPCLPQSIKDKILTNETNLDQVGRQ